VQRLKDLGAIEARLLDLAHTTDLKLTAASLAYFAPCSVEDAGKVLDSLAAKNVVEMNVGDDGTITYELRGRQKLAVAKAKPQTVIVHNKVSGPSPLLAALLSLWIPGLGQLYAGRVVSGILWFLCVGLGYVLILPGLILHLFCIVSASSAASAERARLAQPQQLRLAA
jgi:TM2 domain-containing membrane protein YozV